ncbi:MAG: arsenate reductase ArsC [Clostridium sp.]
MKKKVGFICVHNSCRSQMAEALGNLYGSDVFESYSAGTEKRNNINSDAVEVIKEIYNIDMEKNQRSKLLEDIPKLDIVIKMGCNVVCPRVIGDYIEDWGLEDPTGKSKDEFIKIAKAIEEKVRDLRLRILEKKLDVPRIEE